MYKKLFLVMFCLFFVSLISAVPPFTVVSDTGFEVAVEIHEEIRQNQDYDIHLHVFNFTDGDPITSGITCYINLYNPDGTFQLQLENSTIERTFSYSFPIGGGNFTDLGQHLFIAQCNSSIAGGGTSGSFFVTHDGEKLEEGAVEIYLIIVIVLALFSILCLFVFTRVEMLGLKTLCFWGTYVFTNIINYFLWIITTDTLIEASYIPTFFKWLFYVQTILLFPLLLATIIWYLYIIIYNDEMKRMLEHGVPENEAWFRANKKRGRR